MRLAPRGLPGEDDHALVHRREVRVPAVLRLQRFGKRLREAAHVVAVGLPLDERPQPGLRRARACRDVEAGDVAQTQPSGLEDRSGPEALADDVSTDA